MSWRPIVPHPGPPHPYADLDLRVAELRDENDHVVGYLLVEVDAWWQHQGRLWWKTYSEVPTFSIEFWEHIDGQLESAFIHDVADERDLLAALRSGTWLPLADGSTSALAVQWVDDDPADLDAQGAFGTYPQQVRTWRNRPRAR